MKCISNDKNWNTDSEFLLHCSKNSSEEINSNQEEYEINMLYAYLDYCLF